MGFVDKIMNRGSAGTPAPAPMLRGADCLPASARAKLQQLRDAREAAQSFANAAYRRSQSLLIDKQNTQAERDELVRRFGLRDDNERVVAVDRKIEKISGEISHAQAQRADRDGPYRDASALLSAVDDCVNELRTPVDEALVTVKLGANESPIAAVEKRRAAIAKLQTEIRISAAAPYPAADAKRAMREHILHLAALGEPDVAPCVQSLRAPVLPHFSVIGNQRTLHETKLGSFPVEKTVDAASLLAWAFKDEIIAKLEAQIDSLTDGDDGALTEMQRSEATAKARAEILRLEREEESIIAAAASQGFAIARRPDASPLAVLGVNA